MAQASVSDRYFARHLQALKEQHFHKLHSFDLWSLFAGLTEFTARIDPRVCCEALCGDDVPSRFAGCA